MPDQEETAPDVQGPCYSSEARPKWWAYALCPLCEQDVDGMMGFV